MIVIELLLVLVLSYLIGSINMSIIISKLMGKGDIREQGSKNAGTTNVLRTLGKGPALLVFIWDVLKGVIAIWLSRLLAYVCFPMADSVFYSEELTCAYTYGFMLATFGVVLGHNFPIYFGFKGGKGVATSLGCILAIEPQIGLVCLVAGVSMIALFNMVSIGSIIAAIIYPICIFFMGGSFDPIIPDTFGTVKLIYFIFSIVMALTVIWRHKENIKRIRNGTENKLFKSKEEKFEEAKKKSEEESYEETVAEPEEQKEEAPNEEVVAIKFEPKKEEEKVEEEPKKKKNK